MSIIATNKANYAINFPIAGADHDFPKIWTGGSNAISFQCQWDPGLATGNLVILASNQDLTVTGQGGQVTYPPPLTPIQLLTIDIATAPYSTDHAAGFDLVTAYNFVWIAYRGTGSGNISIATNVKSYG